MEVPRPVYPEVSPDANPLTWSEDEAFLRMGLVSGVSRATTYRPSQLGGNHIQRKIPRYMADKTAEEKNCVKHKTASSSHTPGMPIMQLDMWVYFVVICPDILHVWFAGVIVIWCLKCQMCVAFGMMPECETPRTAFDLIFSLFPDPPELISYDNGCNLHHFILNREPTHFKWSEMVIDEFHAKSHKECSLNYNSGEFRTRATNYSLCEQKNRALKALCTSFAKMDQMGFLEMCRFKLAAVNLYQAERNTDSNRVFWHGPRP